MKIATWNINRVQTSDKINEVVKVLNAINADILILTKATTKLEKAQRAPRVQTYQDLFSFYNQQRVMTNPLSKKSKYRPDERRVMIYSKYNIIRQFPTRDPQSTCCALVQTPYGPLTVYGTLLGTLGARDIHYEEEVKSQIIDYQKFSDQAGFCLIGNLSITLDGNKNYVKVARDLLLQSFQQNDLIPLTKHLENSVDHMVVNNNLAKKFKSKSQLFYWNESGWLTKFVSPGIGVNL